jgi:hypothetical protein
VARLSEARHEGGSDVARGSGDEDLHGGLSAYVPKVRGG